MPRQARLDAPGVLHHVRVRGLERRVIFRDDQDRVDFVARLAALAEGGAWNSEATIHDSMAAGARTDRCTVEAPSLRELSKSGAVRLGRSWVGPGRLTLHGPQDMIRPWA